jgi:hypothetical protein
MFGNTIMHNSRSYKGSWTRGGFFFILFAKKKHAPFVLSVFFFRGQSTMLHYATVWAESPITISSIIAGTSYSQVTLVLILQLESKLVSTCADSFAVRRQLLTVQTEDHVLFWTFRSATVEASPKKSADLPSKRVGRQAQSSHVSCQVHTKGFLHSPHLYVERIMDVISRSSSGRIHFSCIVASYDTPTSCCDVWLSNSIFLCIMFIVMALWATYCSSGDSSSYIWAVYRRHQMLVLLV